MTDLENKIFQYFEGHISEQETCIAAKACEKIAWGYSLTFEAYYVKVLNTDLKIYMPLPDAAKLIVQIGYSLNSIETIKL